MGTLFLHTRSERAGGREDRTALVANCLWHGDVARGEFASELRDSSLGALARCLLNLICTPEHVQFPAQFTTQLLQFSDLCVAMS